MKWIVLAALLGGTWYGLTIYLADWYLFNTETGQAIEGFALLLYAWPVMVFIVLVSLLFLPWAFGAHKRVAESTDRRTIKRLESELQQATRNEKSAYDRAKKDANLTVSKALKKIGLQEQEMTSREGHLIEKEALAAARIEQARLDMLNAKQSISEALVKKQQAQGAAARLMKKRSKQSS